MKLKKKSSKLKYPKRFYSTSHYFKQRQQEIIQTSELFIHDKFHTNHFKEFIIALKTNSLHLTNSNFKEFGELSSKYGYEELESEIQKFAKERPDLARIITSLNGKASIKTKKEKEEKEEDNDDDDNDDFIDAEKEELIAKNIDFCIQSGNLKWLKTSALVRVLNSPSRVVHNHHLLFEFVRKVLEERKGEDAAGLQMLVGTLDFEQMTKDEIEFVLNHEFYSSLFSPRHTSELLKNTISENREQSRKIEELEKRILAVEKENLAVKERIENESRETNREIEKLKEKHREDIDILGERLEELGKDIESKNDNIRNLEQNDVLMLKSSIEQINEKSGKMSSRINELEMNVSRYFEENNNNKNKLDLIENNINCQIEKQISSIFIVKPSSSSPGILNELKNKEKDKFDRLFIASQSSVDIYNLINPNMKDFFVIIDNSFVEFEFKKPISINGIIIYSSTQYFPKSFDIEINGSIEKSIINAQELNGSNKKMEIPIKQISCQRIKIINVGPNWDEKENNCIVFKKVELLSPDPKYSKGVFSTLVSMSENQDPHKCPVFISSPYFGFNSFYCLESQKAICTGPTENSWFQIELTKGFAILYGFRLKRHVDRKMKSFKIVGTDDASKPVDAWNTFIEIDEKEENEHELLDTYEFSQPSPITRFVRLIQTGPNWDNDLILSFYHLDFFGIYI